MLTATALLNTHSQLVSISVALSFVHSGSAYTHMNLREISKQHSHGARLDRTTKSQVIHGQFKFLFSTVYTNFVWPFILLRSSAESSEDISEGSIADGEDEENSGEGDRGFQNLSISMSMLIY